MRPNFPNAPPQFSPDAKKMVYPPVPFNKQVYFPMKNVPLKYQMQMQPKGVPFKNPYLVPMPITHGVYPPQPPFKDNNFPVPTKNVQIFKSPPIKTESSDLPKDKEKEGNEITNENQNSSDMKEILPTQIQEHSSPKKIEEEKTGNNDEDDVDEGEAETESSEEK